MKTARFSLIMTGLILSALFLFSVQPLRAESLYISSVGTDSVLQFDGLTGASLKAFVPAGSGGLDNPGGLAFGADNNLYVSSRGTNNVLRYNGVTGAFVDVFVPSGSGGLAEPVDLAFGPDGHLYVSNFAGIPDNILRYNGMTGAFINIFATEATFNTPRHVEFASGVLWASGEADRIWRFDATTGAFINKPQSDNPRGLTLGPDSHMYVSTSFSGIFRHESGTGALIDNFVPGGLALGDNDLAFGPDGHLYVSGGDRVRRFDGTTGAFIDNFVLPGSGGLSDGRYFTFSSQGIIPEPNTLVLLGSGLIGMVGFLKRRRIPRNVLDLTRFDAVNTQGYIGVHLRRLARQVRG
jgi:hypothetical protein